MTVAKVAVENTVYHFDKGFDYLVPADLLEKALPGCRVLVPFGTANSQRQGIILSLEQQEETDKIKAVIAVLDKAPLLSSEALKLITWLKERYFCTLFDAAKLLLPTGINLKIKTMYSVTRAADSIELENFDKTEQQIIQYLSQQRAAVEREKILKLFGIVSESTILEKLCKADILCKSSDMARMIGDATLKMVELVECDETPKLTPKQKSVFRILQDVGTASLKEVCYFSGVTASVVDTLVKKGLARYYETEVYRNPYNSVCNPASCNSIILSPEQQSAYDQLYSQYRLGTGGVSLLYGVTGSGKHRFLCV